MKRTILILCALTTIMFGMQSCKKSKPEEPAIPTIIIGGLFSITGPSSTLGKTSTAALLIAQDDVNAYLAQKNINFRIIGAYADTRQKPDSAVLAFNSAKSAGMKFLVGPQTSSELAAIMPLADAANILLVSQGSTAGSLGIAGDATFRFCPPDKVEGAAIAKTIHDKGIRGLVTIARDDLGNKGLQTATSAAFLALGAGAETDNLTAYSATAPNFGNVITTLKNAVSTMKTQHNADQVGVYIASFEECVSLFKLANAEPELKSVKWFGGDGVVLSAALLNDTEAADFAIATSFFAPSFGLPVAFESKWKPIATRIKTMSGLEPDAFALSVYDAVWTIVRTLEATNGSTDDFATIKTKFVEQAHSEPGITGDITLDENGDRAEGVFDYYAIQKIGTTYSWYITAKSDENEVD